MATWGSVKGVGPEIIPPPESTTRVQLAVESVITSTTQARQTRPWKDEFRTSAQPVCSLLRLLNGCPEGEESFQGDFYFRSGDAIHEVFQTHMPLADLKGARVWGQWRCRECKHTTERPDFKPLRCDACGADGEHLRYHEVTVGWSRRGWNGAGPDPAALSGHIDMILWVPNVGWILVDFKSTGVHYFEESRYARYLPFRKNVLQVESYCAMLRRCWDIDVCGYALVYFCRDQRGKMTGEGDAARNVVSWRRRVCAATWDDEVRAHREEWLNRIVEARVHEMRVREAVGEADGPSAWRAADSLIQHRPCQAPSDYDAYMSAGWLKGGCAWRDSSGRCTVTAGDLVGAAVAPDE